MFNAKTPKKYDDHISIDVVIEHPIYGDVPFTASPDDVMDYGREIHAKAVTGDLGATVSLGKKRKEGK